MDFINKEDEKIINEILDVLNIKYEKHKYFNDGVSSKVILLNEKYLIKQNERIALEGEVEFFKYNKGDLLQKIIYVHLDYKYVIYEFIEGSTMKNVEDPKDTINKLLKIVSDYSIYDKEGYGYFDEKVNDFNLFLESEVEESSKNIKEYISDRSLVNKCLDILKKYNFEKKIIHGDFGTHNFIQKDGKLVGVIDPQTVIGDSLYDILFAIVSNVDLLQSVTLEDIYNLINEDNEKVYAMLVVTLYSRISRCLKYHKEDIDIYMNFYNSLLEV